MKIPLISLPWGVAGVAREGLGNRCSGEGDRAQRDNEGPGEKGGWALRAPAWDSDGRLAALGLRAFVCASPWAPEALRMRIFAGEPLVLQGTWVMLTEILGLGCHPQKQGEERLKMLYRRVMLAGFWKEDGWMVGERMGQHSENGIMMGVGAAKGCDQKDRQGWLQGMSPWLTG